MSFSQARTYQHPTFGPVDSVTSIISATVPKPALMAWGINTALDSLVQHAENHAFQHAVGFGECVQAVLVDELRAGVDAAKKARFKVSKEACNIGTEVHEAIEAWFKDGKYPEMLSEKARRALFGFEVFAKERGLKPIQVEVTVMPTQHPYGGRADLICMMDGIKYLVDFKTSNGFYEPDMPLQLAAYAVPCGIKNVGIIRLDKADGHIEFKDYSDDLDEYFAMFLNLVEFTIGAKRIKDSVKRRKRNGNS